MNNEQWLLHAIKKLRKAGIATARLDCLVLLEDATAHDRSWLLAHPDFLLARPVLSQLNSQIKRRVRHEPLAYIRGKSEFYGREFMVNKDTLEPRPETETIIELIKIILHNKNPISRVPPWKVVDVGTGSGCLGITVKMELPEAEVIATDISPACLKIARRNASNLGAKVKFYQSDLLQSLPSYVFSSPNSMILANLPYVPDGHTINQAAMFEPKIAIFGGSDGLDVYRRLFQQIANFSEKPRYVLTESLPFQHAQLTEIARLAGYITAESQDFIQMHKAAELVRASDNSNIGLIA